MARAAVRVVIIITSSLLLEAVFNPGMSQHSVGGGLSVGRRRRGAPKVQRQHGVVEQRPQEADALERHRTPHAGAEGDRRV